MKKAIVVVSFGTSYIEQLKSSIGNVEDRISKEFREYDVYRAFTSHKIIKKLKENNDISIKTLEEILEDLYESGVDEVLIQPLHLIPGEEYSYIKSLYEENIKRFNTLKLGRPIFYYQGFEELPNDYSLFIDSIKDLITTDKGVVMFGHGSSNPANSVYGCLQTVLEDEGYENVFVGTVEGYPNFETVLRRLKKKNIKEIMLMPLMLVAGDHAINDMASDEEDSWKSMFEAEGIKVNLYMKGLGQLERFSQLYVNRIEDLINNRYEGVGETKKGHRKGINNEDNYNFVKL